VNTDGSDKWVPIVVENNRNRVTLKTYKRLPVKYYTNKKAWINMVILTELLRANDATMGVQGTTVLLFVGNCAAHPQDIHF
jgi:hypothetical protein